MRLMATIAALALLGWNATAHAQTLEIAPTGTTGINGQGRFTFELKNPGVRTLAGTNPIVKVYYNGIEVPDTGYSPMISGNAGSIKITNQVIPAGKKTVKLKVKLDNGATLEKELEVDFQMLAPAPIDPPGGGGDLPPQ